MLSVWIAWDRLLEWFWRPRAVRPGGILRYRRADHWGRRLTLKDRTVVARGDPVLELHFDTGKDLGVWSIASSLPAVLAPLVGSLVIGGGTAIGISTEATYRSVFALAGVFLLLGAAFVLRVRETHPARLTAATT